MTIGTKPLQAHMRYVVDLEGYSFVFRPDRESTEIIQFTRPPLSPTTLKAKLRVVSSELPAKYASLSSLNRSMLLLFTLKSPSLELRKYTSPEESKKNYYCVFNAATEEIIVPDDGSDSLFEITVAETKRARYPSKNGVPSKLLMNLLTGVLPTSKRFYVDEVISADNPENSHFLSTRKSMDYLFNLGVFGFND